MSGVALVTGSSGGLGNAICERLKSDGQRVVGIDLEPSEARLDHFVRCDLGDCEQIDAAFAEVESGLGTMTVLVNNAGFYNPVPFLELTMEQLQTALEINVKAVFCTCQRMARKLISEKRNGAIVNIASISGQIGSSSTDYGATKAAVINMTHSISKDLAIHGIRVNAVAPGVIDAGMGRRMAAGNMDKMMAITPMKRLARADEVAAVVSFLASDAASYVTGSTYNVNGGI